MIDPARPAAGDARHALRRAVLNRLGGSGAAVEEALHYGSNPFRAREVPPPAFPLPDEPHVEDWRRYAAEAGPRVFEYLQERLPQLAIPVREGISRTAAWAEVVLRGMPFRAPDFGGRLDLERPESVRLLVHEHPAGALPVIVSDHRRDFETLVQALAWRGEPRPVGPSVNAQLVGGFINWDRLGRYRREWERSLGPGAPEQAWPVELARLRASEKWRFLDRFVVIGVQPYSGAPAGDLGLGLDDRQWLDLSTRWRVEHEFTHYATRRVFGVMRLNLLDEAIADFMGATYALGTFRAAWFLRFLGLEAWPAVRPDGRVHTYASELSPGAFELVCAVAVGAARGLETLCSLYYAPAERGRFLLALCDMTLELLASEEAAALFRESYQAAGRKADEG